MCNPALIMVGLTAVGSVMSFRSQMVQAEQQQQAARANLQIAKNNAEVANAQARDAIERGKKEERRHRLQVLQTRGQQQAQIGASGVELGSGTTGRILEDTAQIGQMDSLAIRENAAREARGYRNQATSLMNQGNVDYSTGMATAKATKGQAIGSLVTSAGTVANKWYDYKKAS